ncbi:MAG: DNA-3-methyladenine glycosylase family protein [Candidatus Helarchaeota archaeon]
MKLRCALFDLDISLSCGQVFRWTLIDGWWYGVVRDKIIKIRQRHDELDFEIFPPPSDPIAYITRYFRLDDDLNSIYRDIKKDRHLTAAIKNAYGLRLIRQDPWECMISFIISQQNQIPKIKRSLEIIAQKFGTPIEIDGQKFYTFPNPDQLTSAKFTELKSAFDQGGCALGYRAKYVLSSALFIANHSLNFALEDLRNIPYDKAYKILQDSFYGVGPKVADCILLFSLDKLEAFPLDTWIRKIILNLYFKDAPKPINDRILRKFCTQYFGQYAGYAQEYLYYGRSSLSQSHTHK